MLLQFSLSWAWSPLSTCLPPTPAQARDIALISTWAPRPPCHSHSLNILPDPCNPTNTLFCLIGQFAHIQRQHFPCLFLLPYIVFFPLHRHDCLIFTGVRFSSTWWLGVMTNLHNRSVPVAVMLAPMAKRARFSNDERP
jgi:hypothetical protein